MPPRRGTAYVNAAQKAASLFVIDASSGPMHKTKENEFSGPTKESKESNIIVIRRKPAAQDRTAINTDGTTDTAAVGLDAASSDSRQQQPKSKRRRLESQIDYLVQKGNLPRCPGPPAVGIDTAGPLSALIAHSEFAQDIASRMERDGFVVLRGVLAPGEAEAALVQMWDFVETVNPAIRRSDAASWYPQGVKDPWPHAARDMMQLHQAGWVFGELRETLATRVFERLYGTKALHSSKDGFCFQRPTRTPLKRRANDHFDQSGSKKGLHCIQASVALLDQESDDGCFVCWPGSHKHHPALAKDARRDWHMLEDSDRSTLMDVGCAPRRLPVGRGDVVLWRSDLAHCGGSPIGVRDRFRAVVYVCMLPASMTPNSLYPRKKEAYSKLATGSHWPTKEEWFGGCRFRPVTFKPVPFFKSPPVLNDRLQELYGLKRYDVGGNGA